MPGDPGPARSSWGGHTAGMGQRLPAKPVPAGCSFGGKVYALDETWHPDLGEPFGVMRCVLCACETVSGLSGSGRGPHGWGSAGVLGRRSGLGAAKEKEVSLQIFGIFFWRRTGLGGSAPFKSQVLTVIDRPLSGSLTAAFIPLT